MKKFLVGFALPAAAAIAVVGSGFAVWVFGTDAKTQSEDKASINVTQLVKVGSFEQASTSKVVLDQTTAGRTAAGVTTGAVGADLEAKGIYMKDFKKSDGTDSNNQIKYTEASDTTKNHTDHVDGKVKTVKKTYVFIPNEVATYVKAAAGTDTNVTFSDAYTDTYTYTISATSSETYNCGTSGDYKGYVITWKEKLTDCSDTIYLPKEDTTDKTAFGFEYVSEPKTETEYDTMFTNVKDKTIVIISEAVLTKIGA